LRAAAKRRGLAIEVRAVGGAADTAEAFTHALPVLGDEDGPYSPGQPGGEGASLALASLRGAAALTVSGESAAIVTGPVSKAELAKVGFAFPGQTEFVADASGVAAEDAVMMLAGPSLRTVPLTVHVPLAQVPGLITAELILRRCRVVAAALRRDFGLARPRLALCGLNPHAGENGRMGREDGDIIAPAIAALRAEGIEASGPHPADTLFAPHLRDGYDVAVAMYHDQALIPLKALDFDRGVNVTLGLPIVRTSPDHGTAFGIAGTGEARAEATIAAIRMAGEIAARRAAP
jgi:4-hydroxythreonine-4-phosphate dehydrogenase